LLLLIFCINAPFIHSYPETLEKYDATQNIVMIHKFFLSTLEDTSVAN